MKQEKPASYTPFHAFKKSQTFATGKQNLSTAAFPLGYQPIVS
jgi:hypothetical protein